MLHLLFPGAGYDDSTAGQEKEDDAVSPGGYYKYVWDISHNDGPTISDPECLTYSYSSQVDTVRDVNSGLIGALLICKPSQCVVGQRAHTHYLISQTLYLVTSCDLHHSLFFKAPTFGHKQNWTKLQMLTSWWC